MINQFTASVWAKWWLFVLVLPQIIHAGYLKSAGDVKVLEGRSCVLEWVAYTEDEYAAPCAWWYTPHRSEQALVFLEYKDGNRYEFGDLARWLPTNDTNPCSGSLRKEVSVKDAGIYSMTTELGSATKEEAEIHLDVLNGRDLNFSVTVNGEVRKFDLESKLEWTLDLLETDSLVNVSVVLSKAFPPTTTVTISHSDDVPCKDVYNGCDKIIYVCNEIDVSVWIKIETEIIGANQIMINQPLAYLAVVENRARNCCIVSSVLVFTLLLAVTINVVIYRYKQVKRNSKKQKSQEVEQTLLKKDISLKDIQELLVKINNHLNRHKNNSTHTYAKDHIEIAKEATEETGMQDETTSIDCLITHLEKLTEDLKNWKRCCVSSDDLGSDVDPQRNNNPETIL